MAKLNGRFRGKKVYFSQVSNNALRDINLSLKAKGLYALIQSYITIEDFTLYKTTLKKVCKEGDKSFENTWKELKDNGYLIQYRLQGEKGYFYYEYELLDTKNIELANEIHSKQNRKKQQEKNHTPQNGYMDKSKKTIPPKTDDMDEEYDGKDGVYNNMNSTNTYFTNTYEEEEVSATLDNFSKVKGKRATSKEKQLITDLAEKYSTILVNKAIDVMAERSEKITIKYMRTTLENWENQGLTTVDAVEQHIAEWEITKQKAKENMQKSIKNRANRESYNSSKHDSFNDRIQRDYSDMGGLDAIEKKLLDRW